jgi:endo-1,4-beta-D-glucanase Y/4-amino-4-deoxy-L-arabinose transferase-like glycosyltransferase
MKKLNFQSIKKFVTTRTPEFWLVSGLLLIAALAAAWNMFNFPYFENDEATYVSQAWSFINDGKLAPYTYTYDHAPAGWMFLGLWLKVTGGLTTFGHNPLISGRIFIFLLHMASVLMLYIITKRVSRNKLAAYLAVIVFSLSPLEIYFGRRVLLDNIMVFWLLLSLLLATKAPQKLRYVIGSAITFGIAVLTKENALFLAPAILYIIGIYSAKRVRAWAVIQWSAVAGALTLLYPLYAFLHGELFASVKGGPQHVSLLQTTMQQNARGTFRLPWNHASDFYVNLMEWIHRDPVIIIAGAICVIGTMILSNKYKENKALALTVIAGLLFLARGKLIIDFYIIGLVPLLAIVIGDFLAKPVIWAKGHISPAGYGVTATVLLALVFLGSGTAAFTRNETYNQQQSIAWVAKNVPKDAHIVIDNYAYPELHDVDGFKNADFSFKVQYDPAIRNGKYNNDYSNVQYLLITHEEIVQMHSGQLAFVQKAFNQSGLVADYRAGTTSYINIKQLISTNGDWSQVYKLIPSNADTLTKSWLNYKQNFITDNGQVIDPVSNTTTSEGQSYAMLRAIDMHDKVAFDTVWNWTKHNMQHQQDGLFSWKITVDQLGINHITDTNSATDGDQDIAYALSKAHDQWGSSDYATQASHIVNSIWTKDVVNQNGQLYILSAESGATSAGDLLVNPSYLAPANYHTFQKIDPSHNWNKLADDSYTLLAKLQSQSPSGLISNWVAIKANGTIGSATEFNVTDPANYGYDAFRINWRLAAEKQDPRAITILQRFASFFDTQLATKGTLLAGYTLDGSGTAPFSDVAPSAGAFIGMQAVNDPNALKVLKTDIRDRYHSTGNYWGQPYNYYSQNWGAFAEQAYKDHTNLN